MRQTLLKQLEARGSLPTPPGVVLRLLDLTRQDEVSAREIAETIAMDPGLSAKILRFANSPMAGIAREITSLPHAVALMGIKSVKMMALSFAALSSSGAEKCRGFDYGQFGMQALGCGTAAKILATETKVGPPQEAFVAGLFSQIGRAVLAAGMPEKYAKTLQQAAQIPRDLPPLEKSAFDETYTSIGAQLLRTWNIPEPVCNAIEAFRNVDDTGEAPPLARLLSLSEIAAGIICPDTKDGPPDPQEFVGAAGRLFNIEPEKCAAIMNQIASEIEDMLALLDIPKGKMRAPIEIETEVRERIAELSMALHLENQSMALQKEELLRKATTDALTGIANRAAFDARMSLELERSARSSAPFALLMMDVDKFKSFNDTYGHQAGDLVLQNVARVLDDNVRKVDLVARYGGEEFAVIAPDTSPEGALQLGERLRESVESAFLNWEGRNLRVTISIGVAVFGQVVGAEQAPAVVKAADSQLYAAKCAGRNRTEMTVCGLPTPAVHCRS
jgi:diguanylate cyclase (GGDEF)-like protein